MAANLAGMFSQLNNTIGQNPMAEGGIGFGLMDHASRGLGGGLGQMVGAENPMEFMNPGGKQLAGQDQLSRVDLTTPEGLREAAQIAQRMGDQDKALAYMAEADRKEKAVNAKNNALLDAGNMGIQEEVERKKRRSMKFQAIALAKNRGDKEALSGLQSGAVQPEDYLKQVMKPRETKTLADGAMLVGPDGEVLAENPKDVTGTGDLTATMQKRLNATNDAWQEATTLGNEYETMLQQIDERDLKAGWMQSTETFLNSVTGRRDEDDYFRTQAIKLKNSEAIKALPKGPASDRDIAIVMRGFPADNASKEEIRAFLEASSRVARKVAQYEKFKSDWISEHRDERGMISAWEKRAEQMAHTERVAETPPAAIEALQADPSLRPQFVAKYGWLPDE